VASDISLNIIVALSFEINRLYTSTWYGSNIGALTGVDCVYGTN